MRRFIQCYINGERHELRGEQAFMTMADYLRYIKNLTGTKIVCAEGDCGACTTLVARMVNGKFQDYVSVNSCIAKMYLYDGCHIITVEGLGNALDLHPVQESFVDAHGAQCGYCTPGFICAMANMADDLKKSGKEKTEQKVKNYLTGNLCRCTGYEPIIKAGMDLNLSKTKPLSELYNDAEILKDLSSAGADEVLVNHNEKEIYLPNTLSNATKYKDSHNARMISGATDLGVVDNKGKINLEKTLSLNNIDEAYEINESENFIEIGSKVTLSQAEKTLEKDFPEFTRNLHIFASPQIKNVGTIVGNLVNASPIADTIPFLLVNEAKIKLVNAKEERVVGVNEFFKGGYKELDLKENELVKSIILPKTKHDYKLYKVSIRKDLDISTVTFAARYSVDNGKLNDLNLAFGGVGPVVLRAPKLESSLSNKSIDSKLFIDNSQSVRDEITPLGDHRGSQEFRYQLCENLLIRFGDELISQISGADLEASL